MKQKELAQKVLEMLDKQQEYFKARNKDTLQQSKQLEREMRKICEEIIAQDDAPHYDPVREMRDRDGQINFF